MAGRYTGSGALLLSFVVHVFAFGVGSWAAGRALVAPRAVDRSEHVLQLETFAGEATVVGIGLSPTDPVRVVVASLSDDSWEGVTVLARPDLGPAGRGGTDRASEPAVNLAASVDDITLSKNVLDSVIMSQSARRDTGETRRSIDDRAAQRDPGQGAWYSDAPVRPSGRFDSIDHETARAQLGSIAQPARGTPPAVSGSMAAFPLVDEPTRAGTDAAANGASDLEARTSRRAEPPSGATPSTATDRAAFPSPTRGAASDTRASAEQVQTRFPALMQASSAGGPLGVGPGGESGLARPASGGARGFGSLARASGGGDGHGLDVRLESYVQRLRDRVRWPGFPEWAIAQGRGGVAVIGLTILADGSLAEAHVVRRSGVTEFDRNVLDAVRRAAPFDPLPPTLGRRALAVRYVFDATNPAVGRNGSGPGGRAE